MPEIIIKGKSQLFFSDNDPEKTWRLKEKIVAVVESHIQSRDDLYTFSSQRIRNAVGDLEDVDVAFTNFSNMLLMLLSSLRHPLHSPSRS